MSDQKEDKKPQSNKPKYNYYRVTFSEEMPKGVNFLVLCPREVIANPDGSKKMVTTWRPFDLGHARSYYEPRGKVPHDKGARLDRVKDKLWLRITPEQEKFLTDYLHNTKISDLGLSSIAFETDEDVVLPNPRLSTLITVEKKNPQDWEDLRFGERWVNLAHPMNDDDAEALSMISPHNAATKKAVNEMLKILIENSDLTAPECRALFDDHKEG